VTDDGDTLAQNRRAYHDYFIEEKYEAGLALTGTEVKSIRAGKASLREGYARIANGEAWLLGVHISPYETGNRWNHDPVRDRKLLLHRNEISTLTGKVKARGLTLVPSDWLGARSCGISATQPPSAMPAESWTEPSEKRGGDAAPHGDVRFRQGSEVSNSEPRCHRSPR